MKKTIVSLLMAATIVGTVAATATDADAQWRGRGRGWGWGWGPGVAAGVIGGAVVAGAIIASRPPGYVVYEGYAQPVYAPGCYWASQPVYDGAGRVVGYTGQAVQVCPGYAPPPPVGAPPGYAGGPRPQAPRPDMLAARLLAIRSPTASSASGHTIRKPEPIWVMMASAIPVRERSNNVCRSNRRARLPGTIFAAQLRKARWARRATRYAPKSFKARE